MKKFWEKHKRKIYIGAGVAGGVVLWVLCNQKKEDETPSSGPGLYVAKDTKIALSDGQYGDEDGVDILAMVIESKKDDFLRAKDAMIDAAHENDLTIRFDTTY